MKERLFKTTCILLLLASCINGMAQEKMLKTIDRMIQEYPSARHRMEFRYQSLDSTKAMREIRFDFRIPRNNLKQSDFDLLMKHYAQSWDSAEPQTDCMQQYVQGDSICSTIVYGLGKENKVNMSHTAHPNCFWGNPGYLLFDVGKEVSVVVDQMEHVALQPVPAQFHDLILSVDALCKRHRSNKSAVRYTGNEGSFLMQRSKGKGWTRGTRYTIENCARAEYDRLCESFLALFKSNKAVNIIAYNDMIMMKNEQGPEVFVASHHDDNTLYFLSAKVEDEICIPMNWENIDCYNNAPVDFVDISSLDSLFDDLAHSTAFPPTPVQYTGMRTSEMPGFTWQRGNGSGWTRGLRLRLSSITPEEKERIFDVFRSYQGRLGHISMYENSVGTYEEGTKTFYGFRQENDSTAFFIRATSEGEICIPMYWTSMDYFDGSRKMTSKATALSRATQQERYLYGLSNLWASVKQNFVFMDRVTIGWDSLYITMMPRMARARNNHQAVRLMQEMIAHLHDGHTYVYPIHVNTITAPLTTKRIEGKVYVDAVYSSVMQKEGIHRGQELVAINGVPVEQYVRQNIMPYVASSTPQWTEHECYEGHSLMRWSHGEKVTWTLRDGDKSFDYLYHSGNVRGDLYVDEAPVSFSLLEQNIGYLKISSFSGPHITALFDSIYPSITEKTQALIIDIRGNGGGNTNYSWHIAQHFATDTLFSSSWKSPMYVPALASWGYATQWYSVESRKLSPAPGTKFYSRPIVLLVDNGTFSAAEDFCAILRSASRGKLIGSPTGGSTGNGVRVELIPGVAVANICSKHDTAADGTEFVGHGFTPDILVEETYKSYFLDKYDAAVSQACKILKEECRKER